MNLSGFDSAGEWRADDRVAQFFLGQFFAGFTGNEQGRQAINLLQRDIVSGLGTLETAGCFIQ